MDEVSSDLIAFLTHTVKGVANATDHIAGLSARFIISMNAFNAYYEDRWGKVRADLQCMVILPTGSYKTPVKDFIELVYRKTLDTYRINPRGKVISDDEMKKVEQSYPLFSEFTAPAIRRELDRLEDKKSRYKMLILHDEVSTLVKKQNVSGFAEVFEFLSQAADGSIQAYTSLRSGHTEICPPVYNPQFLFGTPTFYPYVTRTFWEQGYAQRVLFGKNEGINISSAIGEDERDRVVEVYKSLFDDVKKVGKVVGTKEFNERYDEYRQQIERKRSEAMRTSTMTTEHYAETKFPKLVLKLSMIHAISRMFRDNNYEQIEEMVDYRKEGETSVDVGSYLEYPRRKVIMDVQDLENAVADLEIQREVYSQYYNEWVERNQMKYRPIENTDSVNRFLSKCKLISGDPKNLYQVINNDGLLLARKNEKGHYFPLSPVSRLLNWNKNTLKEVIGSLIDQDEIEFLESVRNVENNNKPMNLLRLKS